MPALALELCLSVGEVTDPLVRPGGAWVSGVHTMGAGDSTVSVLRMWSVDGRHTVDLLVDPVPATGRGSSGGVHAWNHAGDRIFVVTRNDGVVEVVLEGDEPAAVQETAFGADRSWSTPSVGVDGRTVYAVADWSELWSLSPDDGRPRLVTRMDDGYLVDADGPTGRCMMWQRPHMSWTHSRIAGVPVVPGVAVQQPRSTRDGATRGWISDEGGVANVVLEPDVHSSERMVVLDECEHGGPVWGPGQRTWCPSPDGRRIAYARNEQGFGSLWILDRATGTRSMIGRGVHGCVSWEGNTLAAHRSGARTPPQVVVYDMSPGAQPTRFILVEPGDPRWKDADVDPHLVEPTTHGVTGVDGAVVPFRLFRPCEPHGGVIVWIHGGPTDQWQVTFRPRQNYWLSRGWSIAVVDHRGTTGWGRAHAAALEGFWGDLDARDTVAVIDHLHREHGFDAMTTVVMGGSAGGLTALNTARHAPHLVAGAVVSYPVVDLGEMLAGDDPFESHYMPRLIGVSGADDPVVAERSPHRHAHRLVGTPVLVFHGDADQSVPLVHSERLRDEVTSAGGSCRLIVFAGEGHGFKVRSNIEREFAETQSFLDAILTKR